MSTATADELRHHEAACLIRWYYPDPVKLEVQLSAVAKKRGAESEQLLREACRSAWRAENVKVAA